MDYYQINVVYVSILNDGLIMNDLEFVIPSHYSDDEIFDISYNYVSCVSVFPFEIYSVHNSGTGNTMDSERNLSTSTVLWILSSTLSPNLFGIRE